MFQYSCLKGGRTVKTKRVLLVSCAIVALCFTIITGMTYSLFTDHYSAINHLEAGKLNVTLQRTYLEYKVVDFNGSQRVFYDDSLYDFTEKTNNNMFGMNAQEIRIAPGSYFHAKLRILNDNNKGANFYSNVAFNYSVEIVLLSGNNHLAEQMWVTIIPPNGETIEKKLTELTNGNALMVGKLLPGEAGHDFEIKVEFLDDAENSDVVNNLAQEEGLVFDLVVKAVQAQ
jgi:hypothetical protein